MIKMKAIKRPGFTITELMLAVALVSTCMVSVGFVFFDNQRAWNTTYTKANSAIMLDSHMAGKAFESTVRKASCEKYLLDPDGLWVEVYYFASAASANVDRYARMKVESGTFKIEHGIYTPVRQTLYTTDICDGVTAFSFSGSGRCIRMKMTVSDNDSDVSFVSSAIPQNE